MKWPLAETHATSKPDKSPIYLKVDRVIEPQTRNENYWSEVSGSKHYVHLCTISEEISKGAFLDMVCGGGNIKCLSMKQSLVLANPSKTEWR